MLKISNSSKMFFQCTVYSHHLCLYGQLYVHKRQNAQILYLTCTVSLFVIDREYGRLHFFHIFHFRDKLWAWLHWYFCEHLLMARMEGVVTRSRDALNYSYWCLGASRGTSPSLELQQLRNNDVIKEPPPSLGIYYHMLVVLQASGSIKSFFNK